MFNLITQNNKNCSLIFWILQLYINIIIKNKKYLVDNIYKFSNGIDIYIYIYTKSIFLIRYVFCSPTYICAKSNKIMACYEQILLLHNSSVGMAISWVFRVTRPAPPRLERVWEHKNRGWDGFRFKKKTRIGFGAGSGLVIICPAPPRIWIYKFTPTYKYLLPILSDIPLPFSLPF